MLFKKAKISKKRQKLIDAVNNSPIAVGDEVGIKSKDVEPFPRDSERTVTCKVLAIDGDILTVKETQYNEVTPIKLHKDKVVARNTFYVGADPFKNWYSDVRVVNFSFDSIIFNLNILGDKHDDSHQIFSRKGVIYQDLNWNPFVYDKDGNKQYYQRPFVWSVKDNQLFIESIYQDIECGRILVRNRSFKELDAMVDAGETEVGFRDIVDGKQRLNAVRGFILDEYKDMHGNYFSDLSFAAQHKFGNNQLLGYAELPENTPDAGVIQQFLKVNFTGVPQSESHIKRVQSILSKM
jgi:hypothetical protein